MSQETENTYVVTNAVYKALRWNGLNNHEVLAFGLGEVVIIQDADGVPDGSLEPFMVIRGREFLIGDWVVLSKENQVFGETDSAFESMFISVNEKFQK